MLSKSSAHKHLISSTILAGSIRHLEDHILKNFDKEKFKKAIRGRISSMIKKK